MDDKPEETEMNNAYPNLFDPQTYISYRLQEDTQVEISVFNIFGRYVKTLYEGHQTYGSYHVFWNGMNDHGVKVPSGIYIILMEMKNIKQIQKVILIK